LNNLSADSGVVVVNLAQGGHAPIDISECVRYDFPAGRLSAAMSNDVAKAFGCYPIFMRTYIHRDSGLLFVAVVSQLVTPHEPFRFFQASRDHIQRALAVFDEPSRRRHMEFMGLGFDSPRPPEAPAVEAPKPHEAPAVDFASLASALRKDRKGTQAALVECFTDRTEATVDEIAREVHGDDDASDKAIRGNVARTNDSLVELGSPLVFRVASGRVYREISRK